MSLLLDRLECSRSARAMNTHAVVCNDVEGTATVAPGALCFVRQYTSDKGEVLVDVINQDGIWISLWRPFTGLTNFRTKFLPPKHPKIVWAQTNSGAKAKLAALLAAFPTSVNEPEETPTEEA